MHHVAKTVSVLTFKHLDLNGRLQHVAGLAETLQASTANLKDEACKAPLLTKISQNFSRDCPREDTPPSSPRGQPAASGDAPRAAGPTTDGWFDPGTNKKKRRLRPNAASSAQAASSDAAPLRRLRSKASEGTTVPTKGRAPAATPSVTSAAAARAAKQRAQAVAELDHLIGGKCTASKSYQETDNVAVPDASSKSSKDMAIAVAHTQVADPHRTVELLTSTAAKKKFNA
ncbi:unnamed protein product [Peronospora effusa]|nr:unnamed protein product [Peronospora effusa]